MKILLACIFLGFLPFGCGVWAASQHYKPEIEAKIKTLAQLGPDIRHCMKPMDVDCIVDDPR